MDAEQKWHAVETRDTNADGSFVYAVTSTGIYCRPGCPSRLPSRANVRFFEAASDAEAAGFRACKRCGSDGEGQRAAASVAARIDACPDDDATLAQLAAQTGVSPGHLQRAFTRAYGMSPKRYRDAARTEALKAGLRDGRQVADAAYAAGFGSARALYDATKKGLGMSPVQYRNGGTDLEIRYTIVPSAIGSVLVGRTEAGVCAVLLDDEQQLPADLAREFPRASLVRDDAALAEWASAVVALAEGRAARAGFPLDLRGTDFQRRVWAALQDIPPGQTATYTDVARAIGRPTSVRAVANACGDNHVAVVVPCHRVVRRDGGLGGYKWGIDRKRALLTEEGALGIK